MDHVTASLEAKVHALVGTAREEGTRREAADGQVVVSYRRCKVAFGGGAAWPLAKTGKHIKNAAIEQRAKAPQV